MVRADTVSVDHLFESYRRWILEAAPFASIEEELKAIRASAKNYRRLAEQLTDDSLGRFGRFAKAFDVSTATPLVLYLATQTALGEDLADALGLIESYIVRRDICGLTTANYNRFFVETIAKLRALGGSPLDALHIVLSGSQAEASRWPDDSEWNDKWLGRDQYKSYRQPRLRHIFGAIEHRKRADDSEIIAIRSDLTLEHIMPQKWQLYG